MAEFNPETHAEPLARVVAEVVGLELSPPAQVWVLSRGKADKGLGLHAAWRGYYRHEELVTCLNVARRVWAILWERHAAEGDVEQGIDVALHDALVDFEKDAWRNCPRALYDLLTAAGYEIGGGE